MRFNNMKSIVFYCLILQLYIVNIANSQDSLTSKPADSLLIKPITNGSYQNLVSISGFAAKSLNDYFYDNFYKSGIGVQLGIPLFSNDFYTLRFNLAYTSYKFQRSEYLKTDTLDQGENISGTPLETVTFLPDIIIHPMPNYIVSPYVSLGVGVIVGSNLPTYNKTLADGKTALRTKAFGTKYVAQVGTGGIVHVLPYLNVFAGVSYNIEFLRDHQPEDIFYKFKQLDNSYKFLNYVVGVELKLRKK